MKKYIVFLIAIIVIGLASCDNELDINADYKEITIVYGLLDPKQDTQWVRIQRGYLGTAPASASFNEPDSLYYGSLDVELLEFDEDLNSVRTTSLIRDETSIQLNSGLFTTEGFSLYRTPPGYVVTPNYTYQVKVRKESNGPIIAESDLDDTAPVIRAQLGSSVGTVNILDVVRPRQTANLAQPPLFDGLFEWEQSTGYKAAGIYTFEYDEININTKVKTHKSFEVELPTTLDNSYTYRFADLYQAISSNVQRDDNVIRFFRKMTFKVSVINRELDTYLSLNIPTTSITQSQPEYTNITNGLGIFSSRTSAQLDSVEISASAFTTLYKSDLVCQLRFAVVKGGTGDTVICNFVDGGENGEIGISL
jgi:hypothetical protein